MDHRLHSRIDLPVVIAVATFVVLFVGSIAFLAFHVVNVQSVGVAIKKRDVEMLRRCLEVDPSQANRGPHDGYPYLLHCAVIGFDEGVALLLDSGASIDAVDANPMSAHFGRSALHFAAENCHREIVKRLVRHGANRDLKDPKGITPRMIMEKYGLPAE